MAAFFDVDNTILRGASIFYFARELYRRDFFTVPDIARMGWMQARFKALGEKMEHVQLIRERALSFVEGHSVAEITAIGEHVYDEVIADKIWPGTHALAQLHLDAGERVWLVTATPIEMADTIAKRLGLSGALGTVAESVDGVYTGRLVGEPLHGPAKADAIRRSPSTRGSTCPAATPTPTPPTTSRCCSWSATPARSTRTPALRPAARPTDGGSGLPHGPQGRQARRPAAGADPRSREHWPQAASPPPRLTAPYRPPPATGRTGRARTRPLRARIRAARCVRSGSRSEEDRTPLHQQGVERLLDRLADLVGEVEDQHRVVSRARAEVGRLHRRPELDDPLARQRDQARAAPAAARWA